VRKRGIPGKSRVRCSIFVDHTVLGRGLYRQAAPRNSEPRSIPPRLSDQVADRRQRDTRSLSRAFSRNRHAFVRRPPRVDAPLQSDTAMIAIGNVRV
jgi:hypothetical protein